MRRAVLGGSLAAGLAGCTCAGDPAAAPDVDGPGPLVGVPNVLIVVWDTVRADRTSLYGYAKPTTPRTAAWAATHGVVYERAVAPGVWTLPTHASLFTGLAVRTHGVDADHTVLDGSVHHFVQDWERAGFDTWAFVANPYLRGDTGLLRGFATVERPWDRRWSSAVRAHIDAKLLPDDASNPLAPAWPGTPATAKYAFKESGPVAAEALAAWLERREEQDRPFVAFVNLMEAHLPRIPSAEARQALMSPTSQALAKVVPQTMDAFHDHMAGVARFDDASLTALSEAYDASLRDLDRATTALLGVLDRRGLADDTVVVLTSDHGEQLGERGLLLHKYSVHQSLTRVPLVIAWPGHLPAGRVVEGFAQADTLARVAELASLPLSDGLRAQLDARPDTGPRWVSEYGAVAPMALDRLRRRHPGVDLTALHTLWVGLEEGDHKLAVASDGRVELYDVAHDPAETHDLAADRPEVVRELSAHLAAWQAAVPAHPARARGAAPAVDAELAAGLEALGYVQEDPPSDDGEH